MHDAISNRTARSSTLPLAGVALLQFTAHLLTMGSYGFHRDELYLIACGRRLDWGSIDHAPLAPALSRLAELLFGLSPFGQRLPDAIFGALTVFVTGLCVRRLAGALAAQLAAAAAIAVAPIFFYSSGVHGTNSADQLCWALAGFLLLGLVERPSPKQWLALGLVLGAGFLDKYTILLCAGGLFAGLLSTPARAQLRTVWPWIALAVALVVALPVLLWQAGHAWPTLEFIRESNAAFRRTTSLWRIAIDLPRLLGAAGFVFALAGVAAGLKRTAPPGTRAAAVAFLTVVATVLAVHGKLYYAAPAAPLVAATGAIATIDWLVARMSSRGRRILFALWAGSACVVVAGTLPLLPASLQKPLLVFNPELIQFADWNGHVAQIARAFRSSGLAKEGNALVLTDSYGTAAAIELLGPAYGLPPALSGANTYFASAPSTEPDSLLALGYPPALLAMLFDEVSPVATIQGLEGTSNRFDFPRIAYACRKRKRSLRAAWPAFKRFD